MRILVYTIPAITILALVALHVGASSESNFLASDDTALQETKAIYAGLNAKLLKKNGRVWSKELTAASPQHCSIPSF